jgi:hypothetical protein
MKLGDVWEDTFIASMPPSTDSPVTKNRRKEAAQLAAAPDNRAGNSGTPLTRFLLVSRFNMPAVQASRLDVSAHARDRARDRWSLRQR